MREYEDSLIDQFKKGKDIIIDLNKIDMLYILEQKLRKISKCTFRKYSNDKVICRKVTKGR